MLWLLFGACSGTEPRTASVAPAAPAAPVAPVTSADLDARFVDAIAAAGPAYTAWGRVDEGVAFAPTDCAAPSSMKLAMASRVRRSDAADAPHGEKLYFLWASDRAAYLERRPIAKGFTIVKESFRAVPGRPPANKPIEPIMRAGAEPPAPVRALQRDGAWFETGEPAGLFVMTKVAAGPLDGTDAGWIYGTIDPAGRVTSAGRVASCMGCHEDQHDRLFGLH
jgi:hypothetical protein